jgi:orotate phosphoribosyltransferase
MNNAATDAVQMRLGAMSRSGVEQRLDVKEHGEKTARSGFVNQNRRVAVCDADLSDSSIVTANWDPSRAR